MQLKHKIVLLAVLPLLLMAASIAGIVVLQAQRLAQAQSAVVEASLLASKRTELKHYVKLALTAIHPLYASGRDDPATRKRAEAILRDMNYGTNGYFFVYDLNGRNIVHPRLPQLVGKDLWNLRDPEGLPVIQRLVEAAQRGGGFQRYQWEKPSTGRVTDKLGYVVPLPRWGWMLGTGLYLDDVARAGAKVRARMVSSIRLVMMQLGLLVLASVLLVSAAGMALNVNAHRLADRRLQELAQRIVGSQEAERTRVARELHDGISQLLTSTKYRLELAQHRAASGEGDAAEAIARGLGGVTEAIAEVRRISHDLHPLMLDRLGLPAALQQLAEDFGERTGVAVRTELPREAAGLGERGALTLFRIAQEALTNIERHSGARSASLRLGRAAEMLRLSVGDDGRGFDASRIDLQRGIGLRNMRERLEYQGGRLELHSGPSGTELVASLPAPRPHSTRQQGDRA